MKPPDLIVTARELIGSGRKPRQSNLRRATSSAYYALFHALSRCCADTLTGTNCRTKRAWRHVYRALDHKFALDMCRNKNISSFPQEVQDFANAFVSLQSKRHSADYDPHAQLYKSAVQVDVDNAELVLKTFRRVPVHHRRAFAIWVLLRQR
ncbi:hypothetical protein [Aestuariivirga sp.]|uniref:hypothetical protein n=1 Tax=Aestuariivirga sp. TaxID=2650926 RepID=UPI0039E2B4F1